MIESYSKLNKINTTEIVAGPQFNCLSGMVPVTMPHQIFKQYNVLWKGKRPKIGVNKLCLPRDLGGLALPNVEQIAL